ncbi:feruloyl-CoA synthase [Ostreiculturibacter nitratireducens]|uniref:feruloyl-CoA synthase n=1 Tax=Ostreiculturibacter nitratireducens TaxID=3075226 RepID=UPI0031B5D119
MARTRYLSHEVIREDRPDGSILLRSAHGLGPVASRTTDWLHDWAERTPDAVFLAERDGEGWRKVTYTEALTQVRAIAAGLLARGLGAETPILIISGNGVDHGLLTLAAQYVGVPTVPVAEQYALIPEANRQLEHVTRLTHPRMVYAVDGDRFGAALNLPWFDGLERVVSVNVPEGTTAFANLATVAGPDVDAANAIVGPDTLAKILMTSGSTSSPKGVLTTHRMMCTNQAQLAVCLPFLKRKPPRIVDWLPWNHVFGGSHNFNMMLANGGALYIDDGKPVPALIGRTIENQRLVTGTLAFNVPVGFAFLRDAMKQDADLRRSYFESLDLLFYAGASLPQDVWADLEAMAREVRGEVPLFTSSWGLTETAPACLIQHEPTNRSGVVGVPVPGVTIKLVPDEDMRCEVRVQGPTVTPGYFEDPAKTAKSFDAEGYFITGDAMKFLDPSDMNKGMVFDGRISEDFKLLTGTWVRAANLRLDVLAHLGGLAADVIVTGADRNEIGVFIIPTASLRAHPDASENEGALIVPSEAAEIARRLKARASEGSATRVTRALILSEPPSVSDGEITAKGNLNFRKLLTRRAQLLDRLYDDDDPAAILI